MARRLAGLLIVGMAGAFLWHFALIWVYSGVFIHEPRTWVYGLEVAALAAALVYGAWYTLKR